MSENTPEYPIFDTRFEKEKIELRNKSQELIRQGFHPWPQEVSLTSTANFNAQNSRFYTTDIKTPDQATQEVLTEAEKLSGKKWEAKLIVETFDQNQKRAHIFLRQIK